MGRIRVFIRSGRNYNEETRSKIRPLEMQNFKMRYYMPHYQV